VRDEAGFVGACQ